MLSPYPPPRSVLGLVLGLGVPHRGEHPCLPTASHPEDCYLSSRSVLLPIIPAVQVECVIHVSRTVVTDVPDRALLPTLPQTLNHFLQGYVVDAWSKFAGPLSLQSGEIIRVLLSQSCLFSES